MQFQLVSKYIEKVKALRIFQSGIPQKLIWLYGTYRFAQTILPMVQSIAVHLLWKSNLQRQYGNGWAIVTGGGDGLGKAYAIELAKMGYNIIIVGRTQDKLDQTKQQIQQEYNVQMETIQFDFDTTSESSYKELHQKLIRIGEIAILINNVGTFEMHPFEHEQKTSTLINVNVNACTYLSQMLVPHMKQRSKKSLIVFVGSETGERPHSGCAIQSSTKAYIGNLARSLAIELSPKIDVRLVTPGLIATNLLDQNKDFVNFKTRLFVCTPTEVAQQSLRKVTIQTHIIGTWKHGLLQYLQNKQKN
ncbi:unnamed protein product (macronuclear) [Paramecium tetraurelia]|uniref:Uncharacterized protein n=1 Tax=Paramecium tetraurelia TaxID=5888 RepID=A0CDB9_PARTE|nr:uncharacterized protein GSPATT00006997001 [Paramecium tetraurelia]CAK68786.1 unnamed protein product [Paramecium tetraurelia]|eukprot:XP_001436183.1 hypothetical protein (macronuclear) [Paramecium tetraurelia strain d4-2]